MRVVGGGWCVCCVVAMFKASRNEIIRCDADGKVLG